MKIATTNTNNPSNINTQRASSVDFVERVEMELHKSEISGMNLPEIYK
jgi:hypothetical protein